ncbi:unnamed protein product, partial [Urochloa humidicola]
MVWLQRRRRAHRAAMVQRPRGHAEPQHWEPEPSSGRAPAHTTPPPHVIPARGQATGAPRKDEADAAGRPAPWNRAPHTDASIAPPQAELAAAAGDIEEGAAPLVLECEAGECLRPRPPEHPRAAGQILATGAPSAAFAPFKLRGEYTRLNFPGVMDAHECPEHLRAAVDTKIQAIRARLARKRTRARKQREESKESTCSESFSWRASSVRRSRAVDGGRVAGGGQRAADGGRQAPSGGWQADGRRRVASGGRGRRVARKGRKREKIGG